jgi:hypothetical protein
MALAGRRTFLLLGLWLLTTPARAQDFQSWNEVDLSAAWKRVDLLAPFVARTDTSAVNPQLAATGLLVDLPLGNHVVLTAGYLFADLPQSMGGVNIPLGAATAVFRPSRFTIADRNRFEKLIGYGTGPVRYRNRALLDWKLDARDRWHLFVDDELFWNLSNQTWNQNRLQAGAGYRLSRRLNLDLYYLQKNPAGSAAVYVLGSDLTVRLKQR